MADIELVIKIPEEIYKHILSMQFYIPGSRSGKSLLEKILKAIRTGTPLPEGHGDLIDRNECLKLKMTDLYDKDGITMYAVPTGNILRMKPVIEADKENKE